MSASPKMQNAPEIAVGTRVRIRPAATSAAVDSGYYGGTGTVVRVDTNLHYPYHVQMDHHHGVAAFWESELQVLCSDNTDAETALDQIYTVLTDNSIGHTYALDKITTIIENTGRN